MPTNSSRSHLPARHRVEPCDEPDGRRTWDVVAPDGHIVSNWDLRNRARFEARREDVDAARKRWPLADRPAGAERLALGLGAPGALADPRRGLAAVETGERRAPRVGEWYLSADEAWKAPGDLQTSFKILRLVLAPPSPAR